MRRFLPVALLAALLAAALAAPARAQDFFWPQWHETRVCPAASGELAPPAFDAPQCRDIALFDVDPQDGLLWVRVPVRLGPAVPAPAGVYVSARAASAVWLNGAYLGANGRPGADAGEERPGVMDLVLYAPPGLLEEGENTVVLLMSAHRGFVRLGNPVHLVAIGTYGDPAGARLQAYWPALLTFGALFAGAVYFAAAALRGSAAAGSGALALAAASACAQLVAEVLRGLWAYPYPVHDLRLVAIVAFAALSGSALCLFAWAQAFRRGYALVFTASLALASGAALAVGSFDLKAVIALLGPIVFAVGALSVAALRGKRRALAPLGLLALFAAVVLVAPGQFLDRYFYLMMAGLLFALFARQALMLAEETRRRREEQGRALRLEQALARARERSAPTRLPVSGAGRIDLVEAERIVRCQAAGDYVELHLDSGACLLHDGTLGALEAELPETFLRVHRSHIVNTGHIAALERDPSGVGELVLETGARVPVSRRILPRVRGALRGVRPGGA